MSLIAAYYPFDDDTVKDRSGANNHGTPTDITYEAGQFGQAAIFNGTSSHIALPISSGVISLTLVGWFRCTGPSNVQRVLLGIETGRTSLLYQRSMAADSLGLHDGAIFQSFGPTPPQNEWHHIAYVLNAATSKANCYLDTVQSGSELNYTPRAISGNIELGKQRIVASGWFVGNMDELRIYYEVLSVDQIKLLFHHNYLRVLALSV